MMIVMQTKLKMFDDNDMRCQ